MRMCKWCKKEKNIEEFVKYSLGYRYYCKQCHNEKYYKKKGRIIDHDSRGSIKSFQWRNSVKKRDDWKCVRCNSTEKLHAHHIIPFKDDISKRFDIDNGETLCRSCHAKEEYSRNPQNLKPHPETQFKKGHVSYRKGKTGYKAWNKGIKLLPHQIAGKETQFKKGQVSIWKGKKRELPESSKLTQFKKGVSVSPETQFKKGMIPWNKGLKKGEKRL